MHKKILFFMLIGFMLSCRTDTVFSAYASLDKAWEKDEENDI